MHFSEVLLLDGYKYFTGSYIVHSDSVIDKEEIVDSAAEEISLELLLNVIYEFAG